MKLNSDSVKSTYERLKSEYRSLTEGSFNSACPSKITIETRLGEKSRIMQMPLSAMVARLQDGTSGVKAVLLDENTGDMTSYTSVFYPDGTSKVVESTELTRLRCALMAAFATEGRVELKKGSRVGFIGAGRINLCTAQVLNILFGVEDFVIVGSTSNPAKNFEKFWDIGRTKIDSFHTGFEYLKTCDVVISATTAMTREDSIHFSQLEGPKLFISQDGGFIFGESFRSACRSFSDSPTQILDHWKEEFPWDQPGCFVGIEDMNRFARAGQSSVVYLYGIAMADVVVAEAA